ncbi:MAG: AAA family ATPase [Candidatus Aenigmatarchaeota archaeon]
MAQQNNGKNIVMMHGYICSLKSTVAKNLAEKLNIPRLETKQLGAIHSETDKAWRYRLLSAMVKSHVRSDTDMILDGTFGKKPFREAIYRLSEELGLGDVVVVRCVCDDDGEVWKRVKGRTENDDICILEWVSRKHDAVEFDKYRNAMPSIIEVDTKKFVVRPINMRSDFSRKVADSLAEIVGSMKKPTSC